jgi:hypothetical protein
MSPEKAVSWNFLNLLKECGTIEFRRPPKSEIRAPTVIGHLHYALLGIRSHTISQQ